MQLGPVRRAGEQGLSLGRNLFRLCGPLLSAVLAMAIQPGFPAGSAAAIREAEVALRAYISLDARLPDQSASGFSSLVMNRPAEAIPLLRQSLTMDPAPTLVAPPSSRPSANLQFTPGRRRPERGGRARAGGGSADRAPALILRDGGRAMPPIHHWIMAPNA